MGVKTAFQSFWLILYLADGSTGTLEVLLELLEGVTELLLGFVELEIMVELLGLSELEITLELGMMEEDN